MKAKDILKIYKFGKVLEPHYDLPSEEKFGLISQIKDVQCLFLQYLKELAK